MRYIIALLTITQALFAANTRLINGKEVTPGTYKEVVKIETNGAPCTGTVVGPRVVLTAAHCITNGSTAKFTYAGKSYSAKMTRSPKYPAKDHDVALGLVEGNIQAVEPASIGGKATTGLGVILLGYGCDTSGGGASDGKLRWGETVITSFSDLDMVSSKQGGAALCFGDSGGPAFVTENGKRLLLGVNSKGNLEDTNNHTRLDVQESTEFLNTYATQNSVEICGVNKVCGGITPTPTPTPVVPPPKCQIELSATTITLGGAITATLKTSGEVSAASIDGTSVNFPIGEKTWQPQSVGNFSAKGSVTGKGGTGNCSVAYQVNPPTVDPAPTCTLIANPSTIKLGESLTLSMAISGNATTATIQGQTVSLNNATLKYTPQVAGFQSATGSVTGTGGTNSCTTSFGVEGPTPNVPNYTIISTYCGDNVVLETSVRQVCLGIVKYSWENKDVSIREVIVLTYSDATTEVLPIIFAKESPLKPEATQTKVDINTYANNFVSTAQGLMLDTRKAMLTKEVVSGQGLVPKALEGRSGKGGQYFNVERLKKVNGERR